MSDKTRNQETAIGDETKMFKGAGLGNILNFFAANRQNAQLKNEFQELKTKYEYLTRQGTPTYDADCLTLWNKNLDFLKDSAFQKAYARGINSDHRLGDGSDVDIHIEYRIAVCCWAAWHCKRLPGDFVECGTNTGIMSLAICDYIDFNNTGKRFFLFDTFDGIPADQVLAGEEHAHVQNLKYRDCYQVTRRNFSEYPNAVLVKGKVPDTLASEPIERVCYMMLDMNIVTPERAALDFFWDKLVSGGIVLFDDYGWLGYEAQKRAHDAFAASKGLKIFNLPTGQGMLLKP